MARPTKYKKKYCKMMLEYFDIDSYSSKDGDKKSDNPCDLPLFDKKSDDPCDLPLFEGFAALIGVCRDTINQWEKDYPEFSDIAKRCRAIQKKILITNALRGLYNAQFAGLVAINLTDMRNKLETENTNKNFDNPDPLDLTGKTEEEKRQILLDKINSMKRKV